MSFPELAHLLDELAEHAREGQLPAQLVDRVVAELGQVLPHQEELARVREELRRAKLDLAGAKGEIHTLRHRLTVLSAALPRA